MYINISQTYIFASAIHTYIKPERRQRPRAYIHTSPLFDHLDRVCHIDTFPVSGTYIHQVFSAFGGNDTYIHQFWLMLNTYIRSVPQSQSVWRYRSSPCPDSTDEWRQMTLVCCVLCGVWAWGGTPLHRLPQSCDADAPSNLPATSRRSEIMYSGSFFYVLFMYF